MTLRTKYPRTPHLPFSPGYASDDEEQVINMDHLYGATNIVVTEKMDGENATLYRDGYHARSINSRYHESQGWVKKYRAEVGHHIPEGWRVCGENMFAKHAIHYNNLESYFLGFSIWDGQKCLAWRDTVACFSSWGIKPVPVLYEGPCDIRILTSIVSGLDLEKQEGIVVRNTDGFDYSDFCNNVAKWVRPNHVQEEDRSWWSGDYVKNTLRFNDC